MLLSTTFTQASNPPYGVPGVPSIGDDFSCKKNRLAVERQWARRLLKYSEKKLDKPESREEVEYQFLSVQIRY